MRKIPLRKKSMCQSIVWMRVSRTDSTRSGGWDNFKDLTPFVH